MNEEIAREPARRRVGVTLRMLMLVIFVLSVGLALTVNRARRQGAAVAKIARLGGRVGYFYNYMEERGNFPPSPSGDPPAPRWLLKWLGPDYFRRANFVATAVVPSKVVSLPDLAFLDALPDVRVLVLDSTYFPDSEMAHTRPLKLIRFLATDSRIGDEGLAYLADMTELWDLQLSGTRVTDAGLTHLAKLSNLREIELSRTRVTDKGLADLARMVNPRRLGLRGVGITDAGLAPLSRLTNLQTLWLSDTIVGDEGLAHLRGLKALMGLDLSGTRVTDAGLFHLKTLRGLAWVGLSRTGVTDEGVADLRRAMPGLTIDRR